MNVKSFHQTPLMSQLVGRKKYQFAAGMQKLQCKLQACIESKGHAFKHIIMKGSKLRIAGKVATLPTPLSTAHQPSAQMPEKQL
jgi:hypothetical protein